MAATVRLTLADVPLVPVRCRLQWEAAQQAYVILYPEGMVKLSPSAGEIVKRVDGHASIAGIVQDLEKAFGSPDLRGDVLEFLSAAYERGWIEVRDR